MSRFLYLSLLFGMSLALLSGCSREQKAKDSYYDSYYHPPGTPTPMQTPVK